MKKSIILMGIAALVFASCAKDTVKETRKETPIDFRVSVGNKTRATEIYSWNLDCFYVTAVSGPPDGSIETADDFFFLDVPFSRIGEYFYSFPTYYWPSDNRKIAFIGYAPSQEDMGADLNWRLDKTAETAQLQFNILDFAPAQNIKDQVDLLTGSIVGYNEYSVANGIDMYLGHSLSQIEIKACCSSSTYTYKAAGIRIANPKSKADIFSNSINLGESAEFDFVYKDNATAVYEDSYDTPVTLQSYSQSLMNPESGNAILLPQTLTAWDPEGDPTNQANGVYFAVKLQVRDTNNEQVFPATEGEYGWAAVPVSGEWKLGEKYIYTLDFTNGAGYIDPTDPDNPGKNVLGEKIAITAKLSAWEDKSTVSTSSSEIIGHWVGLKSSYIDTDDNIERKFETEEEVRDWLGEFYDFVIIDEHTLKIKNANGEHNTPTSFDLVDNTFLIDCFRVGDEYVIKPYIEYIDDTSVTITFTEEFSSYERHQTIYYTKRPLDE